MTAISPTATVQRDGMSDAAHLTSTPLPARAEEQAGPVQAVSAHRRLRRPPLMAAVGLSALTWLTFWLMAAALHGRVVAADLGGMAAILAAGTAVTSAVLVTLAVAHWRLAGPQATFPVGPAGIAVAGFAQAGVAALLGAHGPAARLWSLAAALLAFIGVAVALAAIGAEFSRRARRTHDELRNSKVAACTDGILRQARQAVETGHRHDVRSALFVVDGAARTLAARYADLSDDDRRAMAEMVADGIDRLTALIDLRLDAYHEVPVGVVVKGVVHAERQDGGFTVRTSIPSDMRVVGRAADLGAVLRTLTASVRYGGHFDPSDPVRVRGEVREDLALIFVEPGGSSGPAAAPEGWAPLPVGSLQPDRRSADYDTALDLYVAARLVDDQGGDLWACGTPGGPRSYAVRLPVAEETR